MLRACLFLLLAPAIAHARQRADAPMEAMLVGPNTAGADQLGVASAMTGDTAVLGAQFGNGGTGSAEVFVRTGTLWSWQATLVGSDSLITDRFGLSAAVDGDTIVVGAPLHDANGQQSGAAYVFMRSGGTWSQQAKLVSSDIAAGDYFGLAVALRGDMAFVTSIHTAGGGSGAVYVFHRTGSSWNQDFVLTAPSGESMGISVSFDGSGLLVGANRDGAQGPEAGAAHVFRWNGSVFQHEAKLLAADGGAGDWLGWSVGIAGDVAVVGAPHDDPLGADSGSAYVFRRNGATWMQEQKVTDPAGDGDDEFGWSIAVAGDRIVVGSPRVNPFSTPSGAARIFRYVAGVWSAGRRLVPTSTFGALGLSVAIVPDRAIVGAPNTYSPDPLGGAGFVFRVYPVIQQLQATDRGSELQPE